MRILILLCLLLPLQAISATSLWRVSKEGKEVFIGGTVHVLSQHDYPLPPEFNAAYDKAQTVVFETDLNGMNDPKMQTQWLQRLVYSNGQTLKIHLKPATYKALADYMASIKMPIDSVAQFKPTLVMLTLMMSELQRLGMGDSGVDLFFNRKALAEGKPLGQLESVEKQLEVLENMAKGREDALILSTLSDIKQMPVMMTDLKNAWRTGNLSKLEEIGITPMRKEFPALFQSVLVERNRSWLPKIEAFLQTPETELILVGALHLAGKEGLILQLQQLGYKVEPF
jgi:uncharacterized protein YbaP (TraB family)